MRVMAFYLVWVVVLLAAGCGQDLKFDARGIAHGSGERDYKYAAGAVKLREYYKDGNLIQSQWFAPDGSLVQASIWQDGTGEGIYLREDGSIRTRIEYVNGIAEGEAVEYDEAGNGTKVMYYVGKRLDQAGVSTHPDSE